MTNRRAENHDREFCYRYDYSINCSGLLVRSEFKLLFCFHQLTDNGNQTLQREEILKLLCALETKLQTEIAKAVMLLPSVIPREEV